MKYVKLGNDKVSTLALGCMRLPTIEGDVARIDMEKTQEIVDYAIKNGINYFDTAWMYHSSTSEHAIGTALSKYPRDSYFLADKFPGWSKSSFDKKEEIFNTQLERCGVDYFDFYLCHNVDETNIAVYLEDSSLISFLLSQKRLGKIRHLGFSTHGSIKTIKSFLDKYGEHMEFCQIQLNYLDYTFQNAERKVELLKEYGLPIFVMEPVRGGRLAKLPEKHMERLSELNSDYTAPEWALRFAGSTDGVFVTLSGMSSFEQLRQNIEVFDSGASLTEKERNTLIEIGKEMTSNGTVPCTACQYCTSYCPLELNIPWFMEKYNGFVYSGKEGNPSPTAFDAAPPEKRPTACLSCHKCESVCPQHIKITDIIAKYRV